MTFMTFHILGISSSQLTPSFFRGMAQPPSSWPFSPREDLVDRQAAYDLGLETTILEVAPHLMPVQLDLEAGKCHGRWKTMDIFGRIWLIKYNMSCKSG
jgi:hypothetical protein